MIRRKRTAILIEEESFLKITLRRHESLAWCKECGEQVKTITLEEAAEILRVSPRAIYDLIEREAVHVPEFDDCWMAICLKSLFKSKQQTADSEQKSEVRDQRSEIRSRMIMTPGAFLTADLLLMFGDD